MNFTTQDTFRLPKKNGVSQPKRDVNKQDTFTQSVKRSHLNAQKNVIFKICVYALVSFYIFFIENKNSSVAIVILFICRNPFYEFFLFQLASNRHPATKCFCIYNALISGGYQKSEKVRQLVVFIHTQISDHQNFISYLEVNMLTTKFLLMSPL